MSQLNLPNKFYRFFKWFCNPDFFEELQGDLEEAYEENKAQLGETRARKIYRKEVVKMIRPSVFRFWRMPERFNHFVLFKNYYKTSFRSLMRNPMNAFINVFGLAVAIGICLVTFAFFEFDSSVDAFHENKENVFLATFFVDRDGSPAHYGKSPVPLAKMLKQDFPQVRKICRVSDQKVVFKHGDHVFHENMRYVDPEFLEMLTFPLKWGLSGSLRSLNSVILSEKMSIKYFGHDNPTGQDVLIRFNENSSKTFTVGGVAQAFPEAHVIDFDFLINFENLRFSHPEYDLNDWGSFVDASLIQVANPADVAVIKSGMDKYITLQNSIQNDWEINSFEFVQLAKLYSKSAKIIDDISSNSSKEARIGMPILSIFMLLLACFNYINIAIVSATKRLKEIGLRKVIGANKKMVAIQFLSENIMITLFAMIIGLILSITVFIPWMTQLSEGDMGMNLNIFNINFWVFLLSILFVTGILSGLYPAFYISKFEVIRIFKGSVKFGKKNPLTRVFLGIQLVLTCAAITIAVMFTLNNSFQNNRSWGYDQKDALYVHVQDKSSFDQIKAVMLQDPDVTSLSGSRHHLGREVATTIVHLPERQYEVHHLSVEAGYFGTLGIETTKGQVFNTKHENYKSSIVVNELLVKNLNLDDPVGSIVKIDSSRYQVIGVVKDFHVYDFYYKVKPTIFTVAEPETFKFLSMRIRNGSDNKAYDNLKLEWAQLFPEIPFQGGYQEDVLSHFFNQLTTAERFHRVVALIAIMLASLGLYGLVKLNVEGRLKEFSIRKALGAGTKNIAMSIAKNYLSLSIIALTIGIPFSYWLTQAHLNMMYAYPIPMSYTGILIATFMVIGVLLLVITSQIRNVSKTNPVDGLRIE